MWVYNIEEEVDVNGKSVYGEKETLVVRVGGMGRSGRMGGQANSDSLIDPDC